MFDFLKRMFGTSDISKSEPEQREPQLVSVDTTKLPTGMYVNGAGVSWFIQGVVPYKDEYLVIYRPLRSDDWRVSNLGDFQRDFLDIQPLNITLIRTSHIY